MYPYFQTKNIPRRKQILLFKFRSRMINVGNNFGRLTKCQICFKEDDNQEHLFKCDILNVANEFLDSDISIEYSDLFSNQIEKLQNIINRGDTILRKRENIMDKA